MKDGNAFPSPYGVTVIKSGTDVKIEGIIYEFPSPCGVTVIKSMCRPVVMMSV